jgi:hypothetical protein
MADPQVGLDNLPTDTTQLAAGTYGVAAACGLLDDESYHLEYGIPTGCNEVCWVQVFNDCGEPVVLDNTHQPKMFGKEYQGLFRWVADTPLNSSARIYTAMITSGACSCQ